MAAEVFVPKVVGRLADILLQQVEAKISLILEVEEEVGNISKTFKTLQNLLPDAERRKFEDQNAAAVRAWLEELEDIAYEMEDVLEEWQLKIEVNPTTKSVREEKPTTTLLEKVRSFIPSLCACLKQVPVRNAIALKIKGINAKLDSVLQKANRFSFLSTGHGNFVKFNRPMSTSIFDELEVRGRDSDKESLLQHLLPASNIGTSKEGRVKVVSIVGGGGSGKTTLAQFLYNDESVKKEFKLKKWVCVSDSFDPRRIAKALLEDPDKTNTDHDLSKLELDTLFQRVKSLYSKKFLLVFDDVWTEKLSDWQPFRDSLKDGAPGSIILVTTRKEDVARVVGTNHKHDIRLLSDSDCWLIIKRIAFMSQRSDDQLCQRVEKIGEEIAKKCKGLPLAAKTLGGLLQLKDTTREWQEVLDSEIWRMERAAVELFPHFYLSYKELSPELKRCFSYCVVFPKDTRMNVDELIRLWMAQGFLGRPSQTVDDKMEKKGYKYFKVLAMRSFFQEFEETDENVICSCKMHDMVHDFAQFVVKDECRVVEDVDCQIVEADGGRLHHVTLQLGNTVSINPSLFLGLENVRSLFLSCHGESFLANLWNNLKCVKSLTLRDCGLQELPQEIGSLIHMRYLDVSQNRNLKELPEAICNLYFLESLDVSDCYKLEHYSKRIGELVHLRHLMNRGTVAIEKMPCGIEKLTCLRTLGEFSPSANNNGASLNHLAKLKYLERWNLRCTKVVSESSMEMLESLLHLRVLCFDSYPISQLPKWIADESLLNNLTKLVLRVAHLISLLPALGKLSSLEELYLFYLVELKEIGAEFYGISDLHTQGQSHHKDECEGIQFVAFPNLKTLVFDNLLNWERWEDISDKKMKDGFISVSVMPCLEKLTIRRCPKLKTLPRHILGNASSLQELNVYECDKLKSRKEEWNGRSHIPKITIE